MDLRGWKIQTTNIPRFRLSYWPGDADGAFFEIPHSPFAFAMHNIDEIGVGQYAGNFAVFRDRVHPTRMFAPDWLIVPDSGSVRSTPDATFLLVYRADLREVIEKCVLIDLAASTFAPLFIPNPLFAYRFVRLDACHVGMQPQNEENQAAIDRSYRIDTTKLHWFPYYRRDGDFDDATIPQSVQHLVCHMQEVLWQVAWGYTYRIALEDEPPNDAEVITNQVMRRVDIDEIQDRSVEYAWKPDEARLRVVIEGEREKLHSREERV